MNRSKSNRLNITLAIEPQELDVGQMLQISTVFTNTYGQPVLVPQIFMEIVDSTGRVAWDLQVMERNASGFAKLISTRELQPNTRYTIRISPNSDLSPQGFGFFKTTKRKVPWGFLPIVLSPLAIVPLVPKEAEVPVLYIYRTELDSKVCEICAPHEGKTFKKRDPDMIRIGPPELGGETHWRCRCHYDMRIAVNPAYAKVLKIHKMVEIAKIVRQVKQFKAKRRI